MLISPMVIAEAKNAWSYASTFLYAFTAWIGATSTDANMHVSPYL